MRSKYSPYAILFAGLLAIVPLASALAQTLDTDALDQRIRDYILEHPEVVIQSIQRWQQLQQQTEADQAKAALRTREAEIFDLSDGTIAGNPDGDVTVVEFMDYNCGYCRRVFPVVQTLVEEDARVRILFKEFPILGPGSEFASRAALAARSQQRYIEFHNALMTSGRRLEKDTVLAIAGEIGLDVEQLQEQIDGPEIDQIIQRNLALARDLAINGTPSFIIGDEIVRGATSLDHLQRLIAETRRAEN